MTTMKSDAGNGTEKAAAAESQPGNTTRHDSQGETVESLIETYGGWGDHPEYDSQTWREEVVEEKTRRSYWDWVAAKIEENSEDGEDDEYSEDDQVDEGDEDEETGA